jgi:hypothetical protein
MACVFVQMYVAILFFFFFLLNMYVAILMSFICAFIDYSCQPTYGNLSVGAYIYIRRSVAHIIRLVVNEFFK